MRPLFSSSYKQAAKFPCRSKRKKPATSPTQPFDELQRIILRLWSLGGHACPAPSFRVAVITALEITFHCARPMPDIFLTTCQKGFAPFWRGLKAINSKPYSHQGAPLFYNVVPAKVPFKVPPPSNPTEWGGQSLLKRRVFLRSFSYVPCGCLFRGTLLPCCWRTNPSDPFRLKPVSRGDP